MGMPRGHVPRCVAIMAAAVGLLGALASDAETGCIPGARTERVQDAVIPDAPEYLQTIRDPYYGGKITLVTGRPGTPIPGLPGMTWPARTRHQYSSHQAWNADGSLLYLARGQIFLDGNTYEPLQLPDVPKGFWHWSPVEPDLMIIPRADGVGLWNVRHGNWVNVISILGYSQFRSQPRDNPSYDGRRFGLRAERDSDAAPVCIGVELETGKTGPIIGFDAYGFTTDERGEVKARRCGVTASGRYVVLNGSANGSYNDQAHFFDWSTGALVYTQRPNAGRECPGGHGDLGLDEHGNDVFVGVCKGRGEPWSSDLAGRTVALRIPDGTIWALGDGSASHTSCRNSKRPGYCYGSGFDAGSTINAKSMDGERVEFYAEPQNRREKYWDETQAVVSPDGEKILFVSRWNDSFADGSRMFVLDLTSLGDSGDSGDPGDPGDCGESDSG
jgi:hypothetical protein